MIDAVLAGSQGVQLPLNRHRRFSAVSPSGVPGQCLAKTSGPARRVADRKTIATMIAGNTKTVMQSRLPRITRVRQRAIARVGG
jgi:hypothetical protein